MWCKMGLLWNHIRQNGAGCNWVFVLTPHVSDISDEVINICENTAFSRYKGNF